MKAAIFLLTLLPINLVLANQNNPDLLHEFHQMSITHCDKFIKQQTKTPGKWSYFINKHAGGIDGPSTEVYMVQISGNQKNSYKTNYTFIQTLKKCFVHKRGQINIEKNCSEAVSQDVWHLQYNLPNFSYKRYKDKNGVILYTKDIGANHCLMEFEYRASGKHSVYKPIK